MPELGMIQSKDEVGEGDLRTRSRLSTAWPHRGYRRHPSRSDCPSTWTAHFLPACMSDPVLSFSVYHCHCCLYTEVDCVFSTEAG